MLRLALDYRLVRQPISAPDGARKRLDRIVDHIKKAGADSVEPNPPRPSACRVLRS
jgi:hypothetical protein